jgi:tetratricopeptide (TPR) repeat protein
MDAAGSRMSGKRATQTIAKAARAAASQAIRSSVIDPIMTGSWLLILGSLLGSMPVLAETIVVADIEGRGTSRMVGQVLEYTGEQLSLRMASGRVEMIDASRVISILEIGNANYEQARQAIEARRWEEALEQLQQALRTEQRAWVQREIVAASVGCYRNLQQLQRANNGFLALCRSDPKTHHFNAIPLSWSSAGSNPEWLAQARQQLPDPSPIARLIAASWLLTTNDRSAATTALQMLLGEQDPRLVFLAEAQLWRTRTLAPQAAEVARWKERIAAMPVSLRGGPYLVLGQALARMGQSQEAIVAWMRIPILYPQQRPLAAEALFAAAGELSKLGDRDAARGLYQELLREHADSPLAAQAERRLQELAKTAAEASR